MRLPLKPGLRRGRADEPARPLASRQPAGRPLPAEAALEVPGERDRCAPSPAASAEVPASFRALRAVLLGLLLIGALVSAVVAVDEHTTRGKVYPGVYVMDVPVGGLGPLEAMGRISEETGGGSLAVYRFTASAGGAGEGREGARSFEYRSGDLDVDFDVRESARRAYLVGRQGGPMRRLKERLSTRLSGRFPVEADISYDRNLSRSAVEEISEGVERASADARVEIRGAEATLVPHVQGLRADRERTLGSLSLALGTLTSEVAVSLARPLPEVMTSGAEGAYERATKALEGPVRLEAEFPKAVGGEVHEEVAPERVGEALRVGKVPSANDGGEASQGRLELLVDAAALEPYAASFLSRLALDPQDARLDVSLGKAGARAVEVVPARPGSRPAETARQLAGRVAGGLLREGEHRYEVKTEEIAPGISSEEVEKLKPTDLLADHVVVYDAGNGVAGAYDDPERLNNLTLAAGALDGLLVPPGESLSLLALTQGLALARSKPVSSAEEPDRPAVDDGDGLSQAATALYGAALLSGLPVDEREQSPTAPLPYADGGLEAFVSAGSPEAPPADLVVRNDREEYLLVRAEADPNAGTVEVGFYGRPEKGEGKSTPGGELRSVRVLLEEGGADSLARETWRAERVADEADGDVDLGEHTYVYPAPEPPPAPPEPAAPLEESEEGQEEDPQGTTSRMSPSSSGGATTPGEGAGGGPPGEEETGGGIGEAIGPSDADEGQAGPREETPRERPRRRPRARPSPRSRKGPLGTGSSVTTGKASRRVPGEDASSANTLVLLQTRW